MTPMTFAAHDRVLSLRWPDGAEAAFPYVWLRDNCPSAFHPDTAERSFDLLSVPADPRPAAVALEQGRLTLRWADEDHVSRFDPDWLRAHAPGRRRPDPAAAAAPRPWPAAPRQADVPVAEAAALMADDAALRDWMAATRVHGLSLVRGLADDDDAGLAVARRIAFLRETNFGVDFTVASKPNPNNLAYTAEALPLHTDLPNQETPPGFQFLHCVANAADGGASLFLDGFAASEAMRAEDPDGFALLRDRTIPFRFHDAEWDLRKRAPVIACDEDGAVVEVRFNAHIADVFDMGPDALAAYYPAYRRFMALTRDPGRTLGLRLAAGEMAVFDNRRILHGRAAFDPATGRRRLRGCYVDRGDFDSRLRRLSNS